MRRIGLPPAKESLLAGPIRLACRAALRFPKLVLVAGLLLAVASIVLTVTGLEFRTNRLDLLNRNSAYNQRWLAYLDEFGQDDDVVVVVEGRDPARVAAVMDKLAERVAGEPQFFQHVWHRHDLRVLRSKGLHYLPAERLEQLDLLLSRVVPIALGQWNQLNVAERLRQARLQLLAAGGGHDMARQELVALLGQLHAALDPGQDGREPPPAWPGLATVTDMGRQFPSHALASPDGRLGTVLLRLRAADEGLARGGQALQRLRRVVRELDRHEPDVRLGVTGLPVLEHDEMQASQDDMLRAGLVSLVGVAVLFIAGFGGVRLPLMTVLALLLAMAWSFGFATLVVGHLNILSISFGVILIGLGIDFGIHFVARYQQVRLETADAAWALRETASSVGPGIVTGGLTTALAFCTAWLTDFTGVAELGVIAGGGIFLCIAAALLVLPAMILTVDGNDDDGAPQGSPPLPVARMCWPLIRRPKRTLGVVVLVTLGLAAGLPRLRYDHNLLNLQPRNLESVELERRLLERSDRSVWFALSVCDDPAELLARKARFERLPSVQRTEQVAELVPVHDPRRAVWIQQIRRRLSGLPDRAPLVRAASRTELRSELERIGPLVEGPGSIAGPGSVEGQERAAVERLLARLDALAENECLARLGRFQQRSAQELLDHLERLATLADPAPPTLADLPAGLADRFVGRNGRHLLKVYAHGDIWEMEALERFVRDVERVDPRVTGHPVQTFYASRQMQDSYLHAAVYSLLAVIAVLVLDFGRWRSTLLALLPLGLGAVQTFGILGLLDLPLNPANMLVLPLILGIGIDDGVHVVHDFLRQRGRYRLNDSTAAAVLLTSATTMIGFGSLLLARHQGLQSLGQVLTIGVFCCLVNSLLVLPALLSWLTRHRGEPAVERPLAGPDAVPWNAEAAAAGATGAGDGRAEVRRAA